MLRVITTRGRGSRRLELDGTISAEWVPALKQHRREVIRTAPSARVTVVHSDYVDPEGEQLLRAMPQASVDLVASGCVNGQVVEPLKTTHRRESPP